MTELIMTWIITTVSFLIISRLLIDFEIVSLGKSAISAAVFGVLNAVVQPTLGFLPFSIVTGKEG